MRVVNGQLQYYFEHTMRISGDLKTHRLAFIRYKPAPNKQPDFIQRLMMKKTQILNIGEMNSIMYISDMTYKMDLACVSKSDM